MRAFDKSLNSIFGTNAPAARPTISEVWFDASDNLGSECFVDAVMLLNLFRR